MKALFVGSTSSLRALIQRTRPRDADDDALNEDLRFQGRHSLTNGFYSPVFQIESISADSHPFIAFDARADPALFDMIIIMSPSQREVLGRCDSLMTDAFVSFFL